MPKTAQCARLNKAAECRDLEVVGRRLGSEKPPALPSSFNLLIWYYSLWIDLWGLKFPLRYELLYIICTEQKANNYNDSIIEVTW